MGKVSFSGTVNMAAKIRNSMRGRAEFKVVFVEPAVEGAAASWFVELVGHEGETRCDGATLLGAFTQCLSKAKEHGHLHQGD